jgi:hypothetical protein
MDDLHRQQQSSSLYKQQRAAVEESLYQKIKAIGEDKNHYKAEVSRLQLESERLQEENSRLRRNQMTLDAELLKTRQGSQEALDIESTAANSRIELLKAEIAQWKDRVGSQRDLETQKAKAEASCKRLEMRLVVAEEQNRNMSKRLAHLMSEGSSDSKGDSPTQPKLRLFLDGVSKNYETEMQALKDSRETLMKQYRSLEEMYRELLITREAEKREWYARQRALAPLMHEQGISRLLDDGLAMDSRMAKMPWELSPMSPINSSGRTSPGSSSESIRVDTNTDPFLSTAPTGPLPPIPMVNSVPQLRPTPPSSSPVDLSNPFAAAFPRRTGSSSATSAGANRPSKIKPNSEIRVYGRYNHCR